MVSDLISILKDPNTKEDLDKYMFNKEDGLLINKLNHTIFPIINGVPILLNDYLENTFYEKYKTEISKIISNNSIVLPKIKKGNSEFSFSMEWDAFEAQNMNKTWGTSTEDRLQQFYIETNQTPESIKGKTILDAGCGNGLLTAALAQNGAFVVGIDYSNSVFKASKRAILPNLIFVQGDLENPPFADESFDIVISNGVIHHTKNTKFTFNKVAKTVKNSGIFYLWLYKRPFTLYFSIYIRVTDFMRFVVNKLPFGFQKMTVKTLTYLINFIKKIRGRKIDHNELLIDMFDTLTPRYKHYHHPLEVSEWFFENGFSAPNLCHWDNPYGFGIAAKKEKMNQTPGINFNSKSVLKRFGCI